MADNRGKWAAACAAVVAVGASAAHFGDDASRLIRGVDNAPIRGIDNAPIPRPRAPSTGASREELEQAASEEGPTSAVACAAIDFQEVAADPDSTYEDFASWAFEEVNQVPRARAMRIYEAAKKLYEEGDISQLTTIYCEI